MFCGRVLAIDVVQNLAPARRDNSSSLILTILVKSQVRIFCHCVEFPIEMGAKIGPDPRNSTELGKTERVVPTHSLFFLRAVRVFWVGMSDINNTYTK